MTVKDQVLFLRCRLVRANDRRPRAIARRGARQEHAIFATHHIPGVSAWCQVPYRLIFP